MQAQPKQLRALWHNVNGERMWYALHGYDIAAMPTSRGMFGHGRVLPPDWRNVDHAIACSRLLLTKAARRMRRAGFYAGKLWLWLDIRDSGVVSASASCIACRMIMPAWRRFRRCGRRRAVELRPRAEIIRVGVTLLDLSPATARQLDMFLNDDRERQKCEAITHLIDGLNRKFGKRVLTVGPGRRRRAAMPAARSPITEFHRRRTSGDLARRHGAARSR